MRLLLLLREINWLSVFGLIASIVAPIVTYLTTPEYIGLSLGASAIALSVLAKQD